MNDSTPVPGDRPPTDEHLVKLALSGKRSALETLLRRHQPRLYGIACEVSDTLGAEVLELSPENFRQRLSRARRQLLEFARGHCGLVDATNPCRCARKTRAFIRDGIVDPNRLIFAQRHVERARRAATHGQASLERTVADAGLALWRALDPAEPPDLAARLRSALLGDAFRSALHLP